MVALSLTRELGPVVTAPALRRTGRNLTDSRNRLEKAGEQLAAMDMMAVNPVDRILAPRFWAGIISMPLLATLFSAAGVIGGYIVGVVLTVWTVALSGRRCSRAWIYGTISVME